MSVPREIRLQRVKERSLRKFGDRALLGGDLYERERGFFGLVSSRAENTVEEWIRSFGGPVIRVDGTKPIDDNIRLIIKKIYH